MADSSIFDDFEEPAAMSRAFCQQVAAQEYSDNVASETDKALGELCLLLDKEPEIYAKVLRKRKREEVENDGVISFMKSKVLGLVQGNDYTNNLVSDVDCMRQTNALKAGICRTFQYAQEIKNEPVRHSQRLASKLATSNMRRAGEKSKAKTKRTNKSILISNNGAEKMSSSDCGDGQQESCVDRPHAKSQRTHVEKDNNDGTGKAFQDISSSDNDNNQDGSSVECSNVLTIRLETDDNVDSLQPVTADESKSVPPPPGPPPPLPAHLTSHLFQNSTPTGTVKTLSENFLSKLQNTSPDSHETHSSSDVENDSPSLTASSKRGRTNGVTHTHQSKSDVALTQVTPDDAIGRRLLRSRKHAGSTASLSTIHSELISSNPVSRLKVTQIVRSPGGTPLRPAPSSRLPSEPLHKALVTAVRSKFKNVYTPSPRSANNSGAFSFSP